MHQRSRHRRLARPTGLAVLVLATGCGDDLYDTHEVTSFSEGVTFHVSDDAIIPYAAIKDDLRPGFDLTTSTKGADGKTVVTTSRGDGAIAKVLPTTGYYEQQVIRALSAALAINLPTTATKNETTTTTNGDGTPKVSVNNVTTYNSGTVPTADQLKQAGMPAGAMTAMTPLKTGDKDRPLEQMDPILQYNLGAALVQEVAMLNKALDYVESMDSTTHDTYVLRLRVAVQPNAPNQPYNAQVALGFFCVKNDQTGQPDYGLVGGTSGAVKVHPLLVADDLEATASARSAQAITQLSLAVSGMIGPTGIGGLFSSNTSKIRSMLGKDLTSTSSVSRTSDNTISVRLGAPRQPTAGYAMVNRNNTVSVVLQVPRSNCDAVNASAAASLRNATTGRQVPDPIQPIIDDMRAGFRRYLESYLESKAEVDAAMQKVSRTDLVQLGNFVRPPNEPKFNDKLGKMLAAVAPVSAKPDAFVQEATGGWRSLWVVLSAKLSHSPYQNVSIRLPASPSQIPSRLGPGPTSPAAKRASGMPSVQLPSASAPTPRLPPSISPSPSSPSPTTALPRAL